jgi:hypothetical protein
VRNMVVEEEVPEVLAVLQDREVHEVIVLKR